MRQLLALSFFFAVAGMSIPSLAAADEAQAVKALVSLMRGDTDQDGLIIVAHRTESARAILEPINAHLQRAGKKTYSLPLWGKLVVIAGRPAKKMAEALTAEFGAAPASIDDIEQRFIVLMDNMAKVFINLLKKEFAVGKDLLKKTIGFATGNLTYGLTMQLVKEMILMRVGWWGIFLFPFTAAVDLAASALGFAATIITATVTGAVLLIQAIPLVLQQILKVTGLGLIKLGKWIIGLFKKKDDPDGKQAMTRLAAFGPVLPLATSHSTADDKTLEDIADRHADSLDALHGEVDDAEILEASASLQVRMLTP